MAKLLYESGINVIVDATANKRRYRDLARSLVPNFAEVYIRAPIDVCMDRERERKAEFAPIDIYKKAAQERATVPGVNVSYEEPLAPEIDADTTTMSPEQSARFIAEKIIKSFG
jgi:adenylylsulfate kinase